MAQAAQREQALSPEEFRERWQTKAVLRAVYRDYYRAIDEWSRPGRRLEVGAGSGNLSEELDGVVASDITAAPWLDAALDAQRLPFAAGSFDGIVGVDVLHHIEHPRAFLREAARVLRPEGRVVLVEPAITPVSRVVFRLGHPEPVDLGADPLAAGDPDPDRHPFDANQAVPTLLAGRDRARLAGEVGLEVVHAEWRSVLAYPLSGGFRRWSLLPARLAGPALRLDQRLSPRIGRACGFRLLLVLERPAS